MLVMPAPPSWPLPGLLHWRLKRAYSQHLLAERAGVGRATIARLEHGAPARIGTVRRLAEALGIEPEVLLKSVEVQS